MNKKEIKPLYLDGLEQGELKFEAEVIDENLVIRAKRNDVGFCYEAKITPDPSKINVLRFCGILYESVGRLLCEAINNVLPSRLCMSTEDIMEDAANFMNLKYSEGISFNDRLCDQNESRKNSRYVLDNLEEYKITWNEPVNNPEVLIIQSNYKLNYRYSPRYKILIESKIDVECDARFSRRKFMKANGLKKSNFKYVRWKTSLRNDYPCINKNTSISMTLNNNILRIQIGKVYSEIDTLVRDKIYVLSVYPSAYEYEDIMGDRIFRKLKSSCNSEFLTSDKDAIDRFKYYTEFENEYEGIKEHTRRILKFIKGRSMYHKPGVRISLIQSINRIKLPLSSCKILLVDKFYFSLDKFMEANNIKKESIINLTWKNDKIQNI